MDSAHPSDQPLRRKIPHLIEERRRISQAHSGVGRWEWNIETGEVILEPETERLYGVPVGTLRSYADWAKCLLPEDLARHELERDKALAERTPFQIEFRVRHPNGEEHWILTRASGDCDKFGMPHCVVGVDIDITDRKRAELHVDFLNRMSGEMMRAPNAEEIVRRVFGALREYLHVDLVTHFEVIKDDQSVRVQYGDQRPGLRGQHRILDFTTAETREHIRAGKEVVIADMSIDPRTSPYMESYRRLGINAAIVMPFLSASIFKGALLVCSHTPRQWRADELQLVRDVVARLFPAMEQARAEASLQKSRERLSSILQQLPIGVGVIDRNGNFYLSNPTIDRYIGKSIPSTDPIGVKHWRVYDEEGRIVPPDQWPATRALRGESVSKGMECLYIDDDGSDRWLLISTVPFAGAEDEVARAIVVLQDIDARKRAEQTLQEANRRRAEFLATLAHELRNPLGPIRNAVHMMKLQKQGDSSARDMIDRQVTYMARLIDDLVDVNRMTHGKLELRKGLVELQSVIQQGLESCDMQDGGGQRTLHVELPKEPVYVDGDSARLAQVFSNLIDNACKYTNPGGVIRIAADVHGERVSVSVSDTGIGIPKDKLNEVFEMFAQVDHAIDRPRRGLGIGLAIVKQLVQLHGGSVSAFSEGRGTGSRFVVELPIVHDRPRMDTSEATAGDISAAPTHRIVIADDDADNARSLAALLSMDGNETYIAKDGIEAMRATEHLKPDTVLLDIGMPGLNGYEVCRRIREQPWGKNITVIAITGWGQEKDRRLSKEVGFDYHLVKPVDYDALVKLFTTHSPHESVVGKH